MLVFIRLLIAKRFLEFSSFGFQRSRDFFFEFFRSVFIRFLIAKRFFCLFFAGELKNSFQIPEFFEKLNCQIARFLESENRFSRYGKRLFK